MKYKAICTAVACAFLLCGCALRETDIKPETDITAQPATEIQTEPQTEVQTETEKEKRSLPVGLYTQTGNGENYRLVEGAYEDDLSHGADINCFAAFPSSEAALSGETFGGIWQSCRAEDVRIEFVLEYKAGAENIRNVIRAPSDINAEYLDYMEIYLYDDVHQTPGVWYSHLTDADMKADTLLTSIKLTPGKRAGEITDIKLSAIAYNDAGDGEGLYTIDVKCSPNRK